METDKGPPLGWKPGMEIEERLSTVMQVFWTHNNYHEKPQDLINILIVPFHIGMLNKHLFNTNFLNYLIQYRPYC